MLHITGPALAIILIVGYLGMNTIKEGIVSLFRKDEDKEPKNK